MEAEEMAAEIDRLNIELSNLEAERDSLMEELDQTKGRVSEIETELKETKKLNYTLARQAPAAKKETFDEALLGITKRG